MNAPRLAIAVATSVALFGVAAVGQENNGPVFTPEIGFTLRCPGGIASREHVLGDFLKTHGFKTKDLSHTSDHSGPVFLKSAVFIGIDTESRIVALVLPDAANKDTFALLLTAPATVPRGTNKLRSSLERFVRHRLKCKVKYVQYGHNSSKWAGAYAEYARKIAKEIRQ